MITLQSLILIVYIVAGAITGLLGWYVWTRRTLPGGTYFALMMAMVAEWTLMDAFMTAAPDAASMLLFMKLSYVGIALVPPLWVLFILSYGRHRRWLTPYVRVLLFVVPAITLALIATNEYHGQVWPVVTPVSGPLGSDVLIEYGPGFLFHATYSYGLMLAGIVLLLREFRQSYEKYRSQVAILLIGVLIPVVANIVYTAGLDAVKNIDLTPVAFCVTGVLFFWGIYRYRLFNILPVARETLIRNMADGMLVLDEEGRVLDLNPSARKMLGIGEAVIGQHLATVTSVNRPLAGWYRDGRLEPGEIVIQDAGGTRWIDVRVSSLSDDRGQPYGKLVALWDITGRKQIEEELRRNYDELRKREKELQESEDRWRKLVELIPASIAIHVDGRIIYANNAGLRLMGVAGEGQIVGQPVLKFLHPDYHAIVAARMRQMHETGRPVDLLDTKIVRPNGEVLDVEMTGMPIPYLGKTAILTVIWDINDRKQAGEKLAASLREKELLLKEIHHRVKNNLQIISSLLSLQTASTINEEASALMIESQNRIRSMALIHEKLYMSRDFARIGFRDYIDSLVASLCRSYVTCRDVRIVQDIEDVQLDIDAAIPCGLIINELITNSLKYAFKDGGRHELRISLAVHDGLYTLVVGDDGVGLPPGTDFRNATTLGLQLVVTLVAQLNGEIELLEGQGTTFRIAFRNAICERYCAPATR